MTLAVFICFVLTQFALMGGLMMLNFRILDLRKQVDKPYKPAIWDWGIYLMVVLLVAAVCVIALSTLEV